MPTEEMTYRKSIDDKLELILKQTTATNGRVRRLENWRWFIVGAMVILGWLVANPHITQLLLSH